MPDTTISRRALLARGSTAAAILGTAPLMARGAADANSRLSIGIIGTGDRGNAHIQMLKNLASQHNVAVTALCDVWQPNLQKTAQRVQEWFGAEPRTCTRFGDLLALKDVDAVTIATPDFSHGPILVAALKAGKDVYVEKPMTIGLADANEALDLARKNKRVVQVGTQYRSHPPILGVAKTVATGVLGKISRVSSAASFNHDRWARGFTDCKEADVDWDAYLLGLPKRPFDPKLLRRWHLYWETSNGLAGLWMTHYIDATHLMLDLPYPARAVAHGGTYVWKDGREHTDTFHAVIEYPDGPLFDWAMNLGNAADWRYNIYGRQGAIECMGTSLASPDWTLSNKGGPKDSPVETQKIEPVPASDHVGNWLECIRSRERPRADIQYGHQHTVAAILCATALKEGRRQKYDPASREIRPG